MKDKISKEEFEEHLVDILCTDVMPKEYLNAEIKRKDIMVENNGIEEFFRKEKDLCNQYANRDNNLTEEDKIKSILLSINLPKDVYERLLILKEKKPGWSFEEIVTLGINYVYMDLLRNE